MSADFEQEIYLSAQRRARIATMVSFVALGVAALAVAAVMALAPLKATKPYVLIVDRATGATERAVEIEALSLSEEAAVRQASLARYVIARETYDAYDNRHRVALVLEQSRGDAEETWRALWDEENPHHPDKDFGETTRVRVSIVEITEVADGVAQIRLRKTLRVPSRPPIEAAYVATVKFGFDAGAVTRIEELWQNPLGFFVEEYRIDALNGQGS